MNTLRNAKRALFSSAIAILLSLSMLCGTTYAWFTDTVNSGNNVIMSGNLDVALEYKSNWSDEWCVVDGDTKIFKEGTLYEPGYTEVVYLRVSNAGSLALKYLLSFNVVNELGSVNVYGDDFRLSDYLQIGTYIQGENDDMGEMFGDRKSALENADLAAFSSVYESPFICENQPILPGEDTVIAIVLTMPCTVGNEANTMTGADAPWIEFGLSLFATQYTYENDSFDNKYDSGASLDNKVHVIDGNDTLTKAFKEGGQGTIVNMHITDVNEELKEGKSLALNMNNAKLERGDETDYAIINRGDLSITGEGTIRSEMKGSIANYGTLYVNNLNIEVTGAKYGFHCFSGEVEINNLDLESQRGGLNVQGGKVTINSANIKFTSYKSGTKVQNGYAIYAVGADTEVVINGGDFRYTGTNNKQRILCAQDGATITVNGGTFGKGSAKTSDWFWEYDSNDADDIAGTITIYGGTFEFDPSAFVAEGYEAVKGENGWWTVSVKSSN